MNMRQEDQRWPRLTKLGDDLKSDDKSLYVRGFVRTIIGWGKKQETVGDVIIFYNMQKKVFLIHEVRVDEYSSTEGAYKGRSKFSKVVVDFNMVGLDSDFTKFKFPNVRVKLGIEKYTREAGVRNHCRNLVAIPRATSVIVTEQKPIKVLINRIFTPFLENRLGEGQKVIYYIASKSKKALESFWFLEKFKKKEYEVLSMVDTLNEFTVRWLKESERKRLISATKEGLELEETEGEQQKQESLEKTFEGFSISFLRSLMLYLHGWLLLVYPSNLPLYLNENTRVTYSLIHLEGKVKVWDAGIDKLQVFIPFMIICSYSAMGEPKGSLVI